MHFQFVVPPPTNFSPSTAPALPSDGTLEVLRELLAAQREQVALMRAANEANNQVTRWRALLARWKMEFPDVGMNSLKSLPVLEGAFFHLLDELSTRVAQEDSDLLHNEFALSEFLDRYGIRVGQLGTLLNVIGPIAEAARLDEQ